MAIGLYLHLSEAHEHEHQHEGIDHEHRHSHGPNDPLGEPHCHWHRHVPMIHKHPHYPDTIIGTSTPSAVDDGWPYRVRLVRGICDAGLLCSGGTQRMVHPGIRGCVRSRLRLRLPSRRVAVRFG
jgi:hypothetical protein